MTTDVNARTVPARWDGGDRLVGRITAGVGASLLVMSVLHLTHVIAGGSPPYDPDSAGTAEGVIALVLLVAADRLRREPASSRGFALGALVFAVVGFLVGLAFTTTSGTVVDVACHAVGLPLLLLALWRQARVVRQRPDPTRTPRP